MKDVAILPCSSSVRLLFFSTFLLFFFEKSFSLFHSFLEMFAPEHIANSFAVDFFETLAKDPSEAVHKFSPFASLVINDFELGVVVNDGASVPEKFQQWAFSLAGKQLVIDVVRGSAVYGGVVAYITFHAVHDYDEFYHLSATLESSDVLESVENFCIRQLTISRVGAVEVEEQPEPTPEPEAKKEPEVIPVPPTPERKSVHAPTPKQVTPRKEVAPTAAAVAAAASNAEPFSWKARVASPHSNSDEAKCVRVVVGNAAAKEAAAAPQHKKRASSKEASPPVKREKRVPQPVGDCLMFNVDITVTDEDIRASLGALSKSLVSLRNCSSNGGRVFMDFAAGVQALEEIQASPLAIGAEKKKVSVFRQRTRADRE